MGTLFGFVVGYVVGARAGSAGFQEVVESVQAIRDSEEFKSFVQVLKHHARATGRIVSDRLLTEEGGASTATADLLARARDRMS